MDTGEVFDKNKKTIILLHGSGQSHVVWSLTTQFLSDHNYNVFAIDFPMPLDAPQINARNPFSAELLNGKLSLFILKPQFT